MSSTSRPVRVGVIGAGHWGPNIIRNFATLTESQLVAVADLSAERRDLIAQKYPGVNVVSGAEGVIDHPEVEAVVICTPTATHYDLTKRALESGKHVFVEKPLSTDLAECNELTDLARTKNLTLFVGHIFVYNASIQAVKKIISREDFGRVYYVHINRTNLGPIRTDVSALWDLAPHDLSILNYWFEDRPSQVSAVGGRFLGSPLEDTAFATYTYPNNVLAQVHVSWLNPKKVREIVVVGEKKMLVWDDMDLSSPVRIYDKKATLEESTEDSPSIPDTFVGFRASIFEGDTVIPKIKLNEPLAAECRAFLRAVADPAASLSGGERGTEVVAGLLAAQASIQEGGRPVEITYR